MKPLEVGDNRIRHGVDACLTEARRVKYGLAMSRKQRLPKNQSYVADLANKARRVLLSEMIEVVGGKENLRAIHFEALDVAYWCDVGCIRASAYLEQTDWIDEKEGDFKPVITSVLKLKAMKLAALKAVGLDRAAAKVDVFQLIYQEGQRNQAMQPVAVLDSKEVEYVDGGSPQADLAEK
jgi:hypothetical protein